MSLLDGPRGKKLLKVVFGCAVAGVLLLLYVIGKSQSGGELPHQPKEPTETVLQSSGGVEEYISKIAESGIYTDVKLVAKTDAYCEYELKDGITLVLELNGGDVDCILLKASIGEPPEEPDGGGLLANRYYAESMEAYQRRVDDITEGFAAAAMLFGDGIKPTVTQIDEMRSLVSALLHTGKKSEKSFGVFKFSAYEIYGGEERQIRIRLK